MSISNRAGITVSKNAVVLFLGTLFRMGLSLTLVVYVARVLGVEGFGKYALTHHLFELFLGLTSTGLGILITREVARHPARLGAYLSSAMLVVTIMSVTSVGLLVLIAELFGYAADTRLAIAIASLALIPATLGAMFEAVFVARETAQYVAIGTVLESVLRAGLGIAALMSGYGLIALFVTLALARLATLLFYAACLVWQVPGIEWWFDRAFLLKLAADGRVFVLETWLSGLNSSLGVIVLSFFHGEAAVGLFAAASKIIRPGTIVALSFTTAVFPYLSRLFSQSVDGFDRFSQRSLNAMLVFILPVIVAMSILADRIVVFVFSDAYSESIPVLRVMVWVLLLKFLNPFMSRNLAAQGRQHRTLHVAAIKLVVCAAIAVLLIPRYSALGTAWTSVLASSAACCLYFAYASGGRMTAGTLLNVGRPVLAALALASFMWLLRDAHLLPLLLAGGVVYGLAVFLFRSLWRDVSPG